MKRILNRPFLNAILLLLIACMGVAAPVHAENRYSVRVPIANIRSGPGTEYSILWKVEKNHPLNVVQKKNGWCQFIDFEGDKGWIYKPLIDSIPSVIVTKSDCNVRSGPGTGHPIVFTSDRGVPFHVLERKNGWIHIQHADGDKGWIHSGLAW